MQKESITSWQAKCIIMLFIFGSTVVMGVSSESRQDSWISVALASVITLPVFLIYARIIKLFPQKNLYEIIEQLFGKLIGKVFIILITWYAIHLGALVLRNFSEFIQIVSMPETPQLPLMLIMLLVTVYLAKIGISALGKWSVFAFPIVMLVVIFTLVFSIQHMNFTNIKPILNHGFSTIFSGAYGVFSFPYAETVLFLSIAGAVKKEDSPYKIYIYSLFISSIFLIVIIIRNILILGPEMVDAVYFPSYVAARIINVAEVLSRIESSISLNFIISGIVKITVCLLAASKGMARLLNISDYKQILMPVSLLVLALCAILYKNAMEMFEFLKYYQFYAIPFQIIIPLIIWITAEIKVKKANKKIKY